MATPTPTTPQSPSPPPPYTANESRPRAPIINQYRGSSNILLRTRLPGRRNLRLSRIPTITDFFAKASDLWSDKLGTTISSPLIAMAFRHPRVSSQYVEIRPGKEQDFFELKMSCRAAWLSHAQKMEQYGISVSGEKFRTFEVVCLSACDRLAVAGYAWNCSQAAGTYAFGEMVPRVIGEREFEESSEKVGKGRGGKRRREEIDDEESKEEERPTQQRRI